MRKLLIAVVVSTLTLCISAPAQDTAPHVPKFITIQVEHVKAGRASAHNKLEADWTAAMKKAGQKTPYIGMVSATGATEAWWISGYDSLGAIEAANNESAANSGLSAVVAKMEAMDTENVDQYSTMIARFNPELSYHPEVNIGDYKLVNVMELHSRLGHYGDLLAANKIFSDARDKVGSKEHIVAFEVVEGARAGTVLYFAPMKSIAESDDSDMQKKMNDAIGEEGWKKLTDIADHASINIENRTFYFLPSASFPSKQVAAANPDFWNPKPMMAKASAAAPEMAAKEAKPAAKKAATEAKK